MVTCSLTGTRPLLVELQALIAGESGAFGRRTTLGVDANRVALLLAILERRVGIDVARRDVFANVAGGVRLASRVASCRFVYDPNQGATQQSGFVWMHIELLSGGERVALAHGMHVSNVP